MQKSHSEQLSRLLEEVGAFTAAEAVARGIPASILSYYARKGVLRRLCYGVYASSEIPPSPVPDLEQLVKKQANFVLCLQSALQVHEITTQVPDALWIAIMQGGRPPKVETYPMQVVKLSKEIFLSDVEEHKLHGLNVKVYSAARTVVDCFKFRNRIGIDVALEALKEGWNKKLFTIDELMRAARTCRVSRIITPYLEGMLI